MFQLSPGIIVTETDLTSIVPSVATTTGAFAGSFAWGPVLDPILISSENNLVSRFGRPNDDNFTSFFTAANFLSYTNSVYICRANTTLQRNAVATPSGTVTGINITNGGSLYSSNDTVTFGAPDIEGGINAIGRLVIVSGAITDIIIDEPGSGYTSAPSITIVTSTGSGFIGTSSITTGGIKINNETDYVTNYINGLGLVGTWAAKYPGALGNSIKVSMADADTFTGWTYANEFDSAPGTSNWAEAIAGNTSVKDELHVIIIDEDGSWTGTRGGILEKFAFVSKALNAKRTDGSNNYYRDNINANSKYVWWMDHPTAVAVSGTDWGSTVTNTTVFKSLTDDQSYSLTGGVDDFAATDGQLESAWYVFANSETYDISLLPVGQVTPAVAEYIINTIVDNRKDCVAFVSPTDQDGARLTGLDILEKTLYYRNTLLNVNTSYAVLDSGWKYMYDRYNDQYRWVPLNGDIAGLCARTDYTNDAWWSPGGLNRGQVKGAIRLNLNPNKTERDSLYKAGINPVVSFPGEGTVLFGDKTLLIKPSAFGHINVRRLFIVLEKAIATAAKYQLFEFNDEFTRAQFRSMTEPFLRDVQGRRGIIEFRVKCNEENNTAEVIDNNEFVADIYIKPSRSINSITLNFIAARTAVSFDEIGG